MLRGAHHSSWISWYDGCCRIDHPGTVLHYLILTQLFKATTNIQFTIQDSEKYVERLLSLFNQFSQLVKDAFDDDPRFLTARDKAYKHVVNDTSVFRLELPTKVVSIWMLNILYVVPSWNLQLGPGYSGSVKTQPESRCPELLANYCDMLLRKTPLSKKLTSDEIEKKLKDVVSSYFSLFVYRSFVTFISYSSLSWNTSKTKMCLCAFTKHILPDVWYWTLPPTVKKKRTWLNGKFYETLKEQ